MKILRFLFLFLIFMFGSLFVGVASAERVDYVVAEVNGRPITLFDLKIERAMENEGNLNTILVKLIDEKILSFEQMNKEMKEFAQKINGFGKYVEDYGKENYFGYSEDGVRAVSGTWKELTKIMNASRSKNNFDRYELKLFQDRQNYLLGRLLNVAGLVRELKVQIFIFEKAREIGVTPAFLKEKFLDKALAREYLLEEFYKKRIKGIFISPGKIIEYYNNLPEGKISFEKAQKKILSNFIDKRIREEEEKFKRDFRGKAVVGVRPYYAGAVEDIGYRLYEIGGEK